MSKRRISVGIDAAKGKSTVCIIDEYGTLTKEPYDIKHTREDLDSLLHSLEEIGKDGQIKAVMEDTGVYHWPFFHV